MTKNPFEQFAKQFFEAFLSPYGEVKLNFEVPGEPRYIDILFAPSPQPTNIPESLGLLRRIASIANDRDSPFHSRVRRNRLTQRPSLLTASNRVDSLSNRTIPQTTNF